MTAEKINAAAWLAAAKDIKAKCDPVPKGFFTVPQIAEALGKAESTARALVYDLVCQGRCEKKIFRIESHARGAYPVPHYRLK